MYFKEKGKINTEECIKLAVNEARERNIKHIVVATSTGDTAIWLEEVKDINVVCVTLAYGYGGAEEDDKKRQTVETLKSKGFKVLTATHALSGAERGISKKFGGINPVEIMAHTLRMFGQGVKVCVEVSAMALDGGLIPFGEEIIAIAGSGTGADTAVVMMPCYASNILDTKINEIICKPRNF